MSGTDDATEGIDISAEFVRENREHIRTLVESLVAIAEGADGDRAAVDEAFRAAHSLKANCEIAGLDDAAAVAHAVEDVLAAARAGNARLDEETADEAMSAVEAIERVVDQVRKNDTPDIDPSDWTERLRGRLDDHATDPEADRTDPEATDDTDGTTATPTEPALDDLDLDEAARTALEAAGDYDDLDALVAAMDDDADEYADLEGGGSFDEVEAAAEAGSDGDAGEGRPPGDEGNRPPVDEADQLPVGDERPAATDERAPAIDEGRATVTNEEHARAAGAESREELPDPDPDVAPWTGRGPDEPDEAFGPDDGISIPGAGRIRDAAVTIAASSLDADRFGVDDGSAGEGRTANAGRAAGPSTALGAVRSLAIEERRLTAALDAAETDGGGGTAADVLASIRAAAETLSATSAADLRRLETLVPDLERAVDRAARHVETPVEFETAVDPVAVDRAVVDRLSDPLVHCIRNAVDHGIEAPRERGAAGKPKAGTVTLRARRDGDRLVVTVSDDGRGVDAGAVRESAIDAGVQGAADATDDEALDLLFEAGLSTAAPDSDLSGRGVGMDVVGRAMDELDGDVTVDSTPGAGTTVRLSVPVAEVVERVRLVAVGAETYAVPSSAVAEVVTAAEATVRDGAVQVPSSELERDAMGTATAFGATLEYRAVDLATALSVPDGGSDGTAGAAPEAAGADAGATGTTAFAAGGGTTDTPDEEPAYLLVDPGDAAAGSGTGGGHEGVAAGTRVALRCDDVLGDHETLVTPLRGVGAAPAVDGAVVCDAGRVVPVLDPSVFVGRR